MILTMQMLLLQNNNTLQNIEKAYLLDTPFLCPINNFRDPKMNQL